MSGLHPRDLLLAAETWAGDRISDRMLNHHRRRLRKIGWERAIEPPAGGWADGDFPVRPGNAVDVLIDGAEALPAIAEELRQATSHVHLTGWYFSPDFDLERNGGDGVLRNILATWPNAFPCESSRGLGRRSRSSVRHALTCGRCTSS
jgi:phosphatidylserine/phosphatidylglycerophosphate/cardiolipin synthase-like enzyme